MDQTAAGRWFGLQAEVEVQTPSRRVLEFFRQCGRAVLTLGFSLGEYDPRRFCDIVVYRRSDSFPVLHFSYDTLSGSELHLQRLKDLLDGAEVGAFCDEFEIPKHLVTGNGDLEVESTEIEWVETPSERRRRFWPTLPTV
ncbi:hypothetical protein ASE01_23730 [Nocardioides sp. Root190]|uniref:hypothetical protein n=1 Tax=Nocardioides sp. Root190 TaxID=1736488 RepID=UPI0006FE7860|nr:hypothetical protein [Nocardioides sp. Root190]KRB78807.1 hypothetical protein ASE01_23730 [Nocardioides sp. Root190]